MLVNEYRLEIQFKKVQKIRNINNIPTVGPGPDHWNVSLRRTYAQNGLYMVFNIMEYALVLLCFYDFLLVVRFRPSSKINPSTLAVLRMIIHGSYSVSKRVLVSIRLGHM
jgi:hypothetical protein